MTHTENNSEWLSARIATLEQSRAKMIQLLSSMRDQMKTAGMEVPDELDNVLGVKKNPVFKEFVSQVFVAPNDKSNLI